LTGSIIHSVQEWPDSSRALIFETNNTGTVSRAHGENSGIAGDNLAATNHFRKLIDPVYCSRYAEIIDSLNLSSEVSIARQWDLMAGACGVQYNMMMIQYMPSQHTVKWSIATSYYGAYHEEAMVLDTNALFTLPSAIQDATAPQVSRLHLYPNPLGPGGVLREASEKELTRVKVYNIKGQKVYDAETLPIAEDFHASGVYIVVSEDVSGISYKNRIICSK